MFKNLARPIARFLPTRTKTEDLPARPADWFAEAFVAEPGSAGVDGEPVVATNGDGRKSEPRIDRLAGFTDRSGELPEDRDERAPILEASAITVRFGGLTAVSDASIEVRQGEIVGLIGPNGAGKTTLFNAILGLNDPTSGRIRLYGHDATQLPPHQRARLGVARSLPGDPALR